MSRIATGRVLLGISPTWAAAGAYVFDWNPAGRGHRPLPALERVREAETDDDEGEPP